MKVKFSKRFKKRYDKSSIKIRNAFKKKFLIFMKNQFHPQLNNHPLKGELVGLRSINVTGDWRALYIERKQNDGGTIVIFEVLGTHSQLYR